jgi:hypothetical protein
MNGTDRTAPIPIDEVGAMLTFIIYCLGVIIAVVVYLFYFNRLVAQIISRVVRLYTWRMHRAYFNIGKMSVMSMRMLLIPSESIQFGVLAGRILFKNIKYVTENQSISILQGNITFRYWLKRVRKNDTTFKTAEPETSK